MTLDQLLAQDDSGVAWLVEVSFDDFATVSYRWSTASFTDASGNDYDGRISTLTAVTRGFGRDHLPAAATVRVTLDNADFGADWLINRVTVASQVLQARFRLSALLFDRSSYASAASLSTSSTLVCIYNCLNQPELTDNTIALTLADDSLGRLAEPLTTPTVRDWFNAATLIDFKLGGPVAAMDWDVPLPLVFGAGEYALGVPAYKAVSAYTDFPKTQLKDGQLPVGTFINRTFPLIICAAKSGNLPTAYSDNEVTHLYGTYRDDLPTLQTMRGVTIEIPRKYHIVDPVGPGRDIEIWKPARSIAFTKSGRSWQVVYVDFGVDRYVQWFLSKFYDQNALAQGGGKVATGYVPLDDASPTAVTSRESILGAFASFSCNATPLSVVSTVPGSVPSWLLVDHIYDAIAYYSKASPSDIDTAAFARARKARQTVFGAGVIQPSRPRPLASTLKNGWVTPNPQEGVLGVLRAALGEMCGSCDADLFMTKGGLYSISTNVFDFSAVTGTRQAIDETRLKNVRIKTPSANERWAPYNRVMLNGPGGVQYGPYDNQTAIDSWGKILPITLQAKWNGQLWSEAAAAAASTVWNYRTLESRVRPIVRFIADRAYFNLELGDYISFTWSRGGQSNVFSGTIFRVESITTDPRSLAVEVEAVWADDLVTEAPFLLDDENFIVRVSSTPGRTCTVQDAFALATFSSGDLIADGLQAGDILVLKDASQTADVFTRYRAIRITTPDATQPRMDNTDLAFSAPAGAAVVDWEIRRGATTYPTSSSDPVNYPSGGTMYGKASGLTDLFSNLGAANLLKDG